MAGLKLDTSVPRVAFWIWPGKDPSLGILHICPGCAIWICVPAWALCLSVCLHSVTLSVCSCVQ